MKKIFLVIALLPIIIFSQPSQSTKNSTTALLDSSAVFTGTIESIADYSWIVVTVKSNIGGTGKVQFTNSNSSPVKWQTEKTFTYTANDTITNQCFVPVTMSYFRVVYTNDTTDQTSFRLTTALIKNPVLPTSTTNKPQVSITSSTLPTGAATSTNQSTLITLSQGGTKYYGTTDTITTRIDTVTFSGATSWIEGSITASDSIEVAINGAFASGETWIITETTKIDLLKWDATTSNKLFIRRYGSAGTPRYYLRIASR